MHANQLDLRRQTRSREPVWCYEAGPTGFGLYRAATAAGIGMQVIAPGKTPRGPSDRVKTDRKDAELLARLLLAGSLTWVVVPPLAVEAAREMTRAHDACRRDLMNARHRVSKMLLRHGLVYPKPKTWTAEHRRWMSAQQFDEPASSMVFADLIAAVDGLTSRKAAIALRLSELASDERWWPTVARLRSFRGIDTLTAFSLHLELGADCERFARAPALSAWLGLTPSLNQSGESSHQGAITKTGSTLARRLLVESAWHYSRMKLHANAGLSLKGRRLLVDRVLVERWPVVEAAEAAGVSERTACKWLARFRSEGEQGLLDRSSGTQELSLLGLLRSVSR